MELGLVVQADGGAYRVGKIGLVGEAAGRPVRRVASTSASIAGTPSARSV
jgi:hypothetical protein